MQNLLNKTNQFSEESSTYRPMHRLLHHSFYYKLPIKIVLSSNWVCDMWNGALDTYLHELLYKLLRTKTRIIMFKV